MGGARTIEPGRERAKAWVYSVINPLLEALKIELNFLSRRNWTFRPYNQELQFIRPLDSYVEFQSRPNWEDFVASNPSTRQKMETRDRKRDELRKACQAAFRHLDDLTEFRQKASDCLSRFRADSPSAGYAGGATPEDNFHRLVAERVINNIVDVPHHDTDHGFWARFRDELIKFRKGPTFEQVDRKGLELEESNSEVSAELAKVRSGLAVKHDIPWAPYEDESLAVPRR